MDRTSYTNLAKAWEFVEDHAFSRQSVELNAVRTRAEETGIAQGSAAQAELLRVLVHMIGASSVIAVGTGSVVETLQLVNGFGKRWPTDRRRFLLPRHCAHPYFVQSPIR